MSTYAVGDLQGCHDELCRLLDAIDFSPGRDRLWLAGDLVNRGPQSLEVLERLRRHRDSLVAVLGNHDLHLLGRIAGVRPPAERDTLDSILDSPRRHELADWLRQLPLVHREGDWILVHGGIPPAWDWNETRQRAQRAEAALRGDDWKSFVRGLADRRSEEADTAYTLTRLRMVDADGRPVFGYSGTPEAAPAGQSPWFALPGRKLAGTTVLFGHWAALGHRMLPDAIALDSACVWGGKLTAVRLEDRHVFQVACGQP